MIDRMVADPSLPDAPPGDMPVHVCSGCGSLVANPTLHGSVCPARDHAADSVGEAVVEWLDSLSADELGETALAAASFDDNPTSALLAELRRRAQAL